MRRRFFIAVSLSILLHSGLWFLWIRRTKPSSEKPPERVAVEWRETKAPVKAAAQSGRGGGKGSSLARFASRWRAWESRGKGIPDIAEVPGGEIGSGWGSGAGNFQQILNHNQHRQLFAHIDGMLYYPPALSRRGISGAVNTRLVFGRDGGCNWQRTTIAGANPYLKFYSLALLKKLCAMEAIKQIGFNENQVVDLSFGFVITDDSGKYKRQDPPGKIVGNLLVFERSYLKSIFEYRVGPLQGLWLVPVVNLDFGWIAENWDRYVNGLDPLREFKEPR